MDVQIIAIGQKMPGWVNDGYQDFAKRLRGSVRLTLTEVPAIKRQKHSDLSKIKEDESAKLLGACPPANRCHRIALDPRGALWSTEQLADKLDSWLPTGKNVALLIGGPEGLSDSLLQTVDQRWSLSPLTFPHPLVRLILAEQIYRANSIITGHPYHRD